MPFWDCTQSARSNLLTMSNSDSSPPVSNQGGPLIVSTLETNRLLLRELVESDADGLFGIFSSPQAMEYWSFPPLSRPEQAVALIHEARELALSGTGLQWAIVRRDTGQLIGKCGFNEIRHRHRRGDVSYVLAEAHWGQGFASEALGALMRYGFKALNLHSLEAGITPGNDSSTRMLQRLGFRLEGHIRENYFAGDRFVDSLIYSLLRSEWQESSA